MALKSSNCALTGTRFLWDDYDLMGPGEGGSAGFCLDGKPLKTKGPEHGELMRWESVVENVVLPKHEKGSYVLVYSMTFHHVDLKMSTQQYARLCL